MKLRVELFGLKGNRQIQISAAEQQFKQLTGYNKDRCVLKYKVRGDSVHFSVVERGPEVCSDNRCRKGIASAIGFVRGTAVMKILLPTDTSVDRDCRNSLECFSTDPAKGEFSFEIPKEMNFIKLNREAESELNLDSAQPATEADTLHHAVMLVNNVLTPSAAGDKVEIVINDDNTCSATITRHEAV